MYRLLLSRRIRLGLICLSALLFAAAGCRGEEICVGPADSQGEEAAASCKLKKKKPYNVVLQAMNVRDVKDEHENNSTGFDDWRANVEGKVLGPGGEVVTEFSGGTQNNEGKKEFESGSNVTVTFGLESLEPNKAGTYDIVVERAKFGERAPREELEVAILKDEWL